MEIGVGLTSSEVYAYLVPRGNNAVELEGHIGGFDVSDYTPGEGDYSSSRSHIARTQ